MEALSALQFGAAAVVASTILHALWQDTLLGLLAALMLAGLPSARASARHALGMAFLLAMIVLPAATVLGLPAGSAARLGALLPAVTAPHVDGQPGVFLQQSAPTADLLALAWALGAMSMLARHLGGWWLVRLLDRGSYQVLPMAWQQRVEQLRAALVISRRVVVHVSETILAPFTAHWLRPAIWLPLSLLTRLPAAQVEALLAHELAHVARLDWLWNGFQRVLESLLFFHPAAWWLGRRIRQEREHACDDLAVAACGDAVALAEALAALERQRCPSLRLVLAAQGGSLMQRITRLLSGPPSPARWGACAGAAMLLVAGLAVAARMEATGRTLPNLRITSTTDGPLGPGDERVITANGLDMQRVYRARMDAQGHLAESYQEDGVSRPIDAHVRQWLSGISQLGVPPPMPPVAPMPPAPPMPPMPDMANDAAFQSLARLATSSPAVIARLGDPAALATANVRGHLDIDDGEREGSADLRFDVRGARASAHVHVTADLRQGSWMLRRVELAPAQ